MSRMSAPTPIYNTKRPEDMGNLNRILLSLSLDERARILTANSTSLIKANAAYNAEVVVTVPMQFSPYVMAAYTTDNTTFYMLPHISTSGTSTIAVTDVLKIKSITNAGGNTSITFRVDTTTTTAITYYIYYIVFKDKIVPTTSIIGN
jgi:hypothetical protein